MTQKSKISKCERFQWNKRKFSFYRQIKTSIEIENEVTRYQENFQFAWLSGYVFANKTSELSETHTMSHWMQKRGKSKTGNGKCMSYY